MIKSIAQYIIKNHPVVWMTGLHIIIPMLVVLSILGYMAGRTFNIDTSVNSLMQILLGIYITFMLAVLIWQYFRFRREISLKGLLKYYSFVIIILIGIGIVTLSPFAGFKHKLETFNKEELRNELINQQSYIWASVIKPRVAKDNNLLNNLINPELDYLYNAAGNFVIRNNDTLRSYLNLNQHINIFNVLIDIFDFRLNIENDYDIMLSHKNHSNFIFEGIYGLNDSLRIYPVFLDSLRQQRDILSQMVDSTLKLFLPIDKLRKEDKLIHEENLVTYSVYDRARAFEKAIRLIKTDSIKLFKEKYLQHSELSKGLKIPLEFSVPYYGGSGYTYIGLLREKIEKLKENNSSLRSKMKFRFFPIFMVIGSVLSIVILSARFNIEAITTPFICIGLLLIGLYIDNARYITTDSWQHFFILSCILITIYYGINFRFKSINWRRSMFLHICHFFLLIIIFYSVNYLYGNVFMTTKEEVLIYSSLFAGSLIINFPFIYMYCRFLKLPIKSN